MRIKKTFVVIFLVMTMLGVSSCAPSNADVKSDKPIFIELHSGDESYYFNVDNIVMIKRVKETTRVEVVYRSERSETWFSVDETPEEILAMINK